MADIMLKLSKKYIDFLAYGVTDGNRARIENLEGTTSAGKTTVGMVKWMLKVATMDEKFHIIAGQNKGVVQRNIINPDLGIKDIFGGLVDDKTNGSSNDASPHLVYHTAKGDKIIYILGYEDEARWKSVLGGQFGAVYIDEVNTASVSFLDNIMMRNRYMMTTLNPDDPGKEIYSRLINRSRPLEKYARDVPKEIMEELEATRSEKDWVYWFFTYHDNPGLTPERLEEVLTTNQEGTIEHRNKVLGLRGRAEGLVFPTFSKKNIISMKEALSKKYTQFTVGVDTSYSQKSDDTMAFIYAGLTTSGEYIVLDEYVKNNRDMKEPLAPSDIAVELVNFIEKNRKIWGGFARYVHIDNADQATITELEKLRKVQRLSYVFMNSDKRLGIMDRINSMNGWLGGSSDGGNVFYKVVAHCEDHIRELERYAFYKGKPEDRNDHTINASQYAWIPHRQAVGVEDKYTVAEKRKAYKNKIRKRYGHMI